jgi:hypothetical protein
MDHCYGGTLQGGGEWVAWYVGALAWLALGALGLTQTRRTQPMARSPFYLMVACGAACLFPINGSVDVLALLLAAATAGATWLGAACALDDMLDRCATLRDVVWLRHLWQAGLVLVLLLGLALDADRAADERATALAMSTVLRAAMLGIVGTFSYTVRRQLAPTAPAAPVDAVEAGQAGEAAAPPVVATVLRCVDCATVAAAVSLALSVVAAALDGRACGAYLVTSIAGAIAAFAAVLYIVMAVTALRVEADEAAGHTYTMIRGLIPWIVDPDPPVE